MGGLAAVMVIPRHAVQVVATAVFEPLSGSAGVLPLRLGRQLVVLAGLEREPFDIRLSIVPVDAGNGVAVILRVAGFAPVIAAKFIPFIARKHPALVASVMACCTHKRRKLASGDFDLAHRERLVN